MFDPKEIGKQPRPSAEQLRKECITLDENGKDMSSGFYGCNHNGSRVGEGNPNWKGGISKDPEHLRKGWVKYNERYKEKKREKYYANREERCRINRERYHASK